ncbi:MAG TPA: hypothetical protein VJQ84_09485 [Solirubrobacterales bacterium]|nr:hypothetical protein [Solirubrobacterales bacterium]
MALILLLPSIAQGEEDQAPAPTPFWLEASNGYRFFAMAGRGSDGGEDGWVLLYLESANKPPALVTYAAPAKVSETQIEANLGKLGRISVTRVPTGRTKTRRICGRRRQVEIERYEGTIEFHGEEGFADVSATEAPTEATRICVTHGETNGDNGGGPGKTLPGARLHAEKRRGYQYQLEFDAVQARPGARTGISVDVEERRGEIEIHRGTGFWAATGALQFDRRLRTATVRPPAPFAGYGSFDYDARNWWTGNLTVDLPGRSDVPVTGWGFSAILEHPYRPSQPEPIERLAQRAPLVR